VKLGFQEDTGVLNSQSLLAGQNLVWICWRVCGVWILTQMSCFINFYFLLNQGFVEIVRCLVDGLIAFNLPLRDSAYRFSLEFLNSLLSQTMPPICKRFKGICEEQFRLKCSVRFPCSCTNISQSSMGWGDEI